MSDKAARGIAPRLAHAGAHRIDYPGLPVACSELLIVGEDNPQSDDPAHALFPHPPGVAGHRLQERIFGISVRTHLGVWRTNLCTGSWSTKSARRRASELLQPDLPWSTVILLGRKVADAADYEDPVFSVALRHDGLLKLVSLPHPSGRNRAWNDARSIVRARVMLQDAVPGIPWGENNDH